MIPDQIVAGDTLDFTESVADYPATDGWTLKYRLTPQFASPTQTPVTLTATTYETTDYRVQAAAATTVGWKDGIYAWARWVEKSGDRRSLGDGRLEVRPDPSSLTQGYDARTTAEKALEDAQAALANFSATGGRVRRYAINGREMEFDAAADILKLVNYWTNEVAKEQAKKAVAAGMPDPRRYYTRISNA